MYISILVSIFYDNWKKCSLIYTYPFICIYFYYAKIIMCSIFSSLFFLSFFSYFDNNNVH